jgi:hypothetical protein
MKTTSLIDALTADHASPQPSLGRGLGAGIAAGALLAAALFAITLGLRPDIATALHSPRFLFKFVATGTLAVSTTFLVLRLSRPGAPQPLAVLLAAPVLLVAAVLAELVAVPSSHWTASLFGTTWRACLVTIPALSVGPLAAILIALRRGAPTRPALAGAVAGLLAGGIGSFVYAAHCPGDSPLFLAAWYTITIAELAAVGALAGSRLLRW